MKPEYLHEDAHKSRFAVLLQEAVNCLAEDFDSAGDVSGAALVDWFSEWRLRVKQALNDAADAGDQLAAPRPGDLHG